MLRCFFIFPCFHGMLLYTVVSAQPVNSERQRCLSVLQEAVRSSDRFFVRVHAAENMALLGRTEGLDTLFVRLQQQSPEQLVGATRVLARVYRMQGQRDLYEHCIGQLLDAAQHHVVPQQRLVALESLAKLGYDQSTSFVQEQARSGPSGMKAMARWVLANSRKLAPVDSLANLLGATDPLLYRYAGYGLRYQPSVSSRVYERLQACAQRIALDDPQRVYVLSVLFVHSPPAQRATTWAALSPYAQGQVGERYEVAEALARRGTRDQLPLLRTLLNDSDQDLRVAAANAILHILRQSK